VEYGREEGKRVPCILTPTTFAGVHHGRCHGDGCEVSKKKGVSSFLHLN
jgi:hypothetical protein